MASERSELAVSTKICSGCSLQLPTSSFAVDRSAKDGLCYRCRECPRAYYVLNKQKIADRSREYGAKNKERRREAMALWRARNPDKALAASRLRRAKNPELERDAGRRYRERHVEKERARWRQWSKNNPEKANALNAKRKASVLRATPPWADNEEILKVYKEARRLTLETGQKWHVDHVVPLRSKLVCGLNVPANLMAIPESENVKKQNRYWPDMP